MTPQDFSDDVCRCARCSGDWRGGYVSTRVYDGIRFMGDEESGHHVARMKMRLAEALSPAVQPEERGRKG